MAYINPGNIGASDSHEEHQTGTVQHGAYTFATIANKSFKEQRIDFATPFTETPSVVLSNTDAAATSLALGVKDADASGFTLLVRNTDQYMAFMGISINWIAAGV